MLTEKQLERNSKGAHAITLQKEERIREAARLSRETQPIEICRIIGIDPQTLRRYAKHPIWQEAGGVDLPTPLYVKKQGRPRDIKRERELITEVYRLHDNGFKWVQVATRLDLNIGQLEYLRSKYPR